MNIQKVANKAADREWRRASRAYKKGDYDALDYGYDKAWDAAMAVARKAGLRGEEAVRVAGRAASAGS